MMKNFKLFLLGGLVLLSTGILHAQRQGQAYLKSTRSNYGLWKVWFTDANTGIVVGEDYTNHVSLILRSTDSGGSWNQVAHPYISGLSANALTDIYFIDTLTGWAVGQAQTVLLTDDAGETWTKPHPVLGGSNFAVFGIDSDTAWLGRMGASLLRTTDGFQTWTNYASDINSVPWDMYFLNADTGFVVLGWCTNCAGATPETDIGGYIFRTDNGGIDWTLEHKDTTTMGYYAIDFVNDSVGYVSGSKGNFLHTTDGGLNWSADTADTMMDLWGMDFMNADTGFVVGGNEFYTTGALLRTTDGGNTWTTLDTLVDSFLSNVFIREDGRGWAVGEQGTILLTQDCGETWELYDWPEIVKYNLTLVAVPEEGGTVSSSPDGTSFESGTVVNVTAAPNTGYQFSDWSTGEEDLMISITMNDDQEITAYFIPDGITSQNVVGIPVRIYPNPTTTRLIIQIDENVAQDTFIELLDYTGKSMYSKTLDPRPTAEHTLDLSTLAEGIYFLRVRNDKIDFTEKIIKIE